METLGYIEIKGEEKEEPQLNRININSIYLTNIQHYF